jgi:hypothetical protein
MMKKRLAGFLAVVLIAQAATGCAFGFDYGIAGTSKLSASAAVAEPTEEESAANPIAVAFLERASTPPQSLRAVPASFKSTVLAQRNNGECETDADCYEDQGYYCEKNSCEGRCGTCWKHPTADEPDGNDGSTPASSGGSAPASSGNGGGGGGSPLAWGLLAVGVVVVLVVLLAASIKKSKQTQ